MTRSKSRKPASNWVDLFSPQLNNLWRGPWKPRTVEPARYLYDHELVLVTEGACTIEMEHSRHDLRAGSYLIIPPDTYHVTTSEPGVYRNCIHFDWVPTRRKKSQPIFRFHPERPEKSAVHTCPYPIPRKAFAGQCRPDVPLKALTETLFYRWQTGTQVSRALGRATLLQILILLLFSDQGPVRPHGLGRDHAYAVRDILERQCDSAHSIQGLLASTGFSYPHMTRLFRSTFGITPVEYRNALRLERAKILLQDPKLAIAEIAYTAGFKDAGYFSRQFRRQNGISPGEFRQSRLNSRRGNA
jgi:AraC-like DNA-binding protein